MRVLITAGPTYEPIDAVRYLGNRSSGRIGADLAEAARRAGHTPSLIVGPITAEMPAGVLLQRVQTAAEMQAAVLGEFPKYDLLIMAAAVADYRPVSVSAGKIGRADGRLVIECEATEDIVAAASRIKRPDQRTIGFSLESRGNVTRSHEKLRRKGLDLIVYNPIDTMSSRLIEAVLIYPDGREEALPKQPKSTFADILLQRVASLFQS